MPYRVDFRRESELPLQLFSPAAAGTGGARPLSDERVVFRAKVYIPTTGNEKTDENRPRQCQGWPALSFSGRGRLTPPWMHFHPTLVARDLDETMPMKVVRLSVG